eukprot:83681_1
MYTPSHPMPQLTYTSNHMQLMYPILSQPFSTQSTETETKCNPDNGLSAEMNQLIEYVLNNDSQNTLSNIPFNISKSNINPRKRQLDTLYTNNVRKKQRTSETRCNNTVNNNNFIKTNNNIVSDVPKISGTLRPSISTKITAVELPMNKKQCVEKKKKKEIFSQKTKQLKYFNEIGWTEIDEEIRYYWTKKGPSKSWRLPGQCHQVIKYQYETKKEKRQHYRKLSKYYTKVDDTIVCVVKDCILNQRPFKGDNRMTKWKSHFRCVHSKEI